MIGFARTLPQGSSLLLTIITVFYGFSRSAMNVHVACYSSIYWENSACAERSR